MTLGWARHPLPPRFYTVRGWLWLVAIVPVYLWARDSVFVVIVMSAWANYASDRAVAEARRAQHQEDQ